MTPKQKAEQFVEAVWNMAKKTTKIEANELALLICDSIIFERDSELSWHDVKAEILKMKDTHLVFSLSNSIFDLKYQRVGYRVLIDGSGNVTVKQGNATLLNELRACNSPSYESALQFLKKALKHK